MKQDRRAEREAYYQQAQGWSQDRHDGLRRSRRIAWLIAGVAMLIAVLEAFALMLLTQLKTVVPYTLLVDRNTGYVQALDPLEPARITGDTALTQSFLVQYVIARESFEIDSLQASYRKVATWSADTARSGYVAAMQASNPASPLARYPRSTVVDTRVKSVSPVSPGVAMIRFETTRRDATGQPQRPSPWVAIVRFRYSGEPMTVEDRYTNPLGFQVLRYRRDPEALPAVPDAPAAASPTTAAAPAGSVSPLAAPLPTPRPVPTPKSIEPEL